MKLWSQIVSSSLVASESYHSRIIGLTVYLLNCLDFLWCLLFHVCWWCSTFPYALALCYSAAEYCAPVWSCSAHTSQVDVQLNSTMRLISGTLRSTPLPWLPVLFNIELPALRRKAATDKLVEKIVIHDSWQFQPDILNPPLLRLTSRKPLLLDLQPVDISGRWRHNWRLAQVVNSHLVNRQPGFDLPWQQWSLLNRFRIEQGHCRKRWRLTDTVCVLVARPRRYPTLSNPTPWQNWMVAFLGYTLWMKMLFRGWPVMVYDVHMRRRRRTLLSHVFAVNFQCRWCRLLNGSWCFDSDVCWILKDQVRELYLMTLTRFLLQQINIIIIL